MNSYWLEFGTVALAHALAVASPGPDFALVLRQSLVHGRRVATWSALGVGCGILVHVGYSLFGVGLLVRHQPAVFSLLKFGGAIYLAWLGWQAWRASFASAEATVTPSEGAPETASSGAWRRGFMTNVLNPKATLFFIALFAVGIDPGTPLSWLIGYGVWMAVATCGWFSLVAWVFTRRHVQQVYRGCGVWVDRAMALVFFAFALNLLWAELS